MSEKGRLYFLPYYALSLVVFEKSCDMLSLLVWCVFGLAWVWLDHGAAFAAFHGDLPFFLCASAVVGLLGLGLLLVGSLGFSRTFFALLEKIAPGKAKEKFRKLSVSWEEMHGYFWADKRRLALVATTSVFIWLLHLLQIWLFILALRGWCPFVANLALSSLAILAGLLPLTFAGVGTRDAALILLYAPYFPAHVAAALGLLCTVRYVLPAIGGLPFFQRYLAKVREPRPET